MAIGPERMTYMMKMLRKSIADYYGDRVPDMATFKNRRRKTFMQALEVKVDAATWRMLIAEAVQLRGTKQGVVTRLNNEQSSKQAEMNARHQQELAELKASHERERSVLIAHYEPSLLEAKSALSESEVALKELKRRSYFAGINAEDDGRSLYRDVSIEEAVTEQVDNYIEQNLGADDEGRAVEKRLREEAIVGDLAFIAEKISDLRGLVLRFIEVGKLPPITVEAWLIEDGKDLV